MYRHAIVALDVDFRGLEITQGSQRALDHARDLAKRYGLRMDLLHSVQPDHFVERGDRGYVVHHEGLPEEGREVLEQARASLAGDGIEARLKLREESPPLAITREVLESGADLVVLGKHNEQETGPRLGSVAARVLRTCPGTIWVVKPDAPERPRRVLVATDLGPVGLLALRAGAEMADAYGSELHVFHAFQLPFGEGLHGEDSFPTLQKRFDEDVRAQAREAGAEKAKFHVGCTSPSRGIQMAQERLGVDLVVMGTVGRGGVPGFLVGNTAEKVLPRVLGSLLVVKPADFISPVTV